MRTVLMAVLAVSLMGCARDGRLIFSPVGGKSATAAPADDGKVLVCHKGKKTMELPREAVDAHLKHGDRRGRC